MTQFSHHTVFQAAIAAHQHEAGALLPILHDIQNQLGYVPPEATAVVAQALNLSAAEVHGVIGFYHYFRHEPAPAHLLHLCVAEACQANGADALWQQAQAWCANQADPSQWGLEPVYCLGQCATGPALTLNGCLKARMNQDKLQRLLCTEAGVDSSAQEDASC